LTDIQYNKDGDSSSIRLFFTPDLKQQSNLWAHCEVDHPFYVKEKGYCQDHLTTHSL